MNELQLVCFLVSFPFFRVGQSAPENLSGLPKYAAYARLLIDGMPSNPFSLQTLLPRRESCDPERAEIIRRIGRRRFPHGNQAQV